MKKTYMTPAATVYSVQVNKMMALSLGTGTGTPGDKGETKEFGLDIWGDGDLDLDADLDVEE